jgi:membrane protease YdiL (CAAX protease family)
MQTKQPKTYLERVLGVWGFILIMWALYRTFLPGVPFWLDELIIKPILFIIPAYYFLEVTHGKKLIKEVHLTYDKFIADLPLILSIIFAVIAAVFIAKLPVLLPTTSFALIVLVSAIATAISQEILLRGFVAHAMQTHWKSYAMAIFFSSILQLFLYVPIFLSVGSELRGDSIIIAFTSTFMIGALNCMLFFSRKSLYVPITLQAVYMYVLLTIMH